MGYALLVLVENQLGVLSKVSGLSSRHAFNIDSLTVGVTEGPVISRMATVVNGDEYAMEQVERQLNKPIPVIKVKCLDDIGPFISCELALTKVSYTPQYHLEIIQTAGLFHVCVVDVPLTPLTIQFADIAERTGTMLTPLRPYGTKEITRAGTVALEQGPRVARKQNI